MVVSSKRTAQLGIGLLSVTSLLATFAGNRSAGASADATGPSVQVIVRGSGNLAAAVRRHGGTITNPLPIIKGLDVSLPASQVSALDAETGVDVTLDQPVQTSSVLTGSTYDTAGEAGSIWNVTSQLGAQNAWTTGATGTGVDIALIDTGVSTNAPGLKAANKVLAGPDFTNEGNSLIDNFGHGTHLAGVMVGNQGGRRDDSSKYRGIAPGARVVSVKVAAGDGITRQAAILAGMSWVLDNHNTEGRNIRVVNLSLAAPRYASFTTDPVAEAAEILWQNGIVVVAATGNSGAVGLSSPAYDPMVIAVGATDSNGTVPKADDTVATFSSRAVATSDRLPDVVAPGRSIQGPTVPGSALSHSVGAIGTSGFVRGSGSSQAAALVSGGIAAILSRQSAMTPDDMKGFLRDNANLLPNGGDARAQGMGLVAISVPSAADLANHTDQNDLPRAHADYTKSMDNTTPRTGVDPVLVSGHWTPGAMTGSSWTGSSWTGSSWTGSSWTGSSWTGSSWTGSSWTGSSWTGSSWTAYTSA